MLLWIKEELKFVGAEQTLCVNEGDRQDNDAAEQRYRKVDVKNLG